MPNQVNDEAKSQSNTIGRVAKKLNDLGTQKVSPMHFDQQKDVVDTQTPKAIQPNPQTLMRQYMPNMLGKHYGRISQVATFISPTAMDRVSDYVFDKLNDFSEKLSSTDAVLAQAGVKSLDKLTQDVARSERISQALIEQNKIMATVQGGVSGLMGVIGSGVDIPMSIFFALKTVYQTGRAYGFVLDEQTQDIVQYVFKQIPLEDIAQKQSLLLAIRSLATGLQTHDIDKLQSMVGSNNDFTWMKKFFNSEEHSSWLKHLPNLSSFAKLTPVVAAGVSATYSYKFIEQAGQTAQEVFSIARHYLIEHPEVNLSPLEAYQHATATKPLLTD